MTTESMLFDWETLMSVWLCQL